MPKPTIRRGGYRLRLNYKGETELHCAIINNKEDAFRSLLEKHHPVNVKDKAGGWTPLHEACNHGRLKMVEMLLQCKSIDCDMQSDEGNLTPIMDAAMNGHYEIVELLFYRGASVIKLDRKNETVLDHLKERGTLVDEPLHEERHRLKLIKLVEEEMRKKGFVPPPKKSNNSYKNLKRSELLKRRKLNRIKRVKTCLGKSPTDNDESDNEDAALISSGRLSPNRENAKLYHKTISAVGKGSFDKRMSRCALLDDDYDNNKPSLITEDEFVVQEDWLDDDLHIFTKKGDRNNKHKTNKSRSRKRVASSCSSLSSRSNAKSDELLDDKQQSFDATTSGGDNFGENLITDDNNDDDMFEAVSSSSSATSALNSARKRNSVIDPTGIRPRRLSSPLSASDLFDPGLLDDDNANDGDKKIDKDVELLGYSSGKRQRSDFATFSKKRKTLRQTRLTMPKTSFNNLADNKSSDCINWTSSSSSLISRRSNEHSTIQEPDMSTRQTPVVLKTTKVIIKIEERKLLVPLLEIDLNKTIGWLAQQAAIRYNDNYGRKPTLRLFNTDKVEIGVNDPINLFLDEELVAEIVSWDLVPLHTKYEDMCTSLGISSCTNLKSIFRLSVGSNDLNLENSGCSGKVATSVLKTLQDNYSLTSINLRGNRLTLENAKDLGVAIVCLKSLKLLILRNVGFTNNHFETLVEGVRSTGPGKTVLQTLNLSYNLFDDNVGRTMEKLSNIAPDMIKLILIGCKFLSANVISNLTDSGLPIMKE